MPEHISRSRYHIRHKRIMDEGAKIRFTYQDASEPSQLIATCSIVCVDAGRRPCKACDFAHLGLYRGPLQRTRST